MSKKRGRPRIVPEDVDQKELQAMTEFCEKYKRTVVEVEENKARRHKLEISLTKASSDFERMLFTQDLERVKKQIEADEESIAFFKWGLTQLEDRTRFVIEQLYVEGTAWEDIELNGGKILANGSVANERLKGLKQLTMVIGRKKRELQMGPPPIDE